MLQSYNEKRFIRVRAISNNQVISKRKLPFLLDKNRDRYSHHFPDNLFKGLFRPWLVCSVTSTNLKLVFSQTHPQQNESSDGKF